MDVTICTVITPMHMRLAGINYDLTDRLNPGVRPTWNVVFNRDIHIARNRAKSAIHALAKRRGLPSTWPSNDEERKEAEAMLEAEKREAFDPGAPEDYLPGVNLLEGYSLQELSAQYQTIFGVEEAAMADKIAKFLGSYMHASALNVALRNVKTRYSIIIDPDLYVVQEDWVARMIERMERKQLALFGVPWNPRWFQKIRGFPCSHFMVIDHERLPFTPGLFAPDLFGAESKYVSMTIRDLIKVTGSKAPPLAKRQAWKRFIRLIHRVPREDWDQRKAINSSRDTGYRLLVKMRNEPSLKFELATPVFDPAIEGFQPPFVLGPQRWRAVEAFIPPERRYMPPPETYSRTGFFERGYPNFRLLAWEEFLVDDEPFAVHVRGELHRNKKLEFDTDPVWLGAQAILAKRGLKPLRGLDEVGPQVEAKVA